ncbi:MAG TPA: DNA alkylation repair protein [Kofleriaceae bacterium]
MGRGEDLANRIARELAGKRSAARAKGEKAYLKSDLVHVGVPMPAIRSTVAASLREVRDLSRAELLAAVRKLWGGVHEHRMAAIELLTMRGKLLTSADVKLVEKLLRDSKSWAYVDVLAARVMGGLIDHDPELVRTLDRWAKDKNFWLRRSALLALLGPLRGGAGDFTRFGRYADAMLDEKEFFIRKAIGWVLRETGRKQPKLVFDWLLPRAERASGVTMREAVKYLPAPQRARLGR